MLDRIILFPYSLTLASRRKHYLRKAQKAHVATICLGNVTVGGTGKTPHTEMVLSMLREAGFRDKSLAVLSRGYKRRSCGFQQVLTTDSASFAGDEPLQIKRKFPDVTVAVHKDRLEGCNLLKHSGKLYDKKYRRCVHKDMKPADIVVLDDALQYIMLRGDLNIMLVDYNRPVDRDSLMPFGRLRDLPSRVQDADVVIVTKCPYELDEQSREEWRRRLGLSDEAKLFFTTVEYCDLLPVYDSTDIRYAYSKRAIIFSGIAADRPFMRYLSDKFKIERRFHFPDHHRYRKSDVAELVSAMKVYPTAAVITTEKDAQRVLDCPWVPDELKTRLLYLPIKASFLTEEEKEEFRGILSSLKLR